MGLYVCFDDSDNDPTYAPVTSAYLVQSDSNIDGNPCSLGNSAKVVSVIPSNVLEIEDFASILGWTVSVDEFGKVVIHTDING